MVYFYLSNDYWFEGVDNLPSWRTWEGYKDGSYCWTLQTYYYLKEAGYQCLLVNKLPPEGIIITHKSNLPELLIPRPRQLIVCCAADWGLHLFAQVNLVQNPHGEKKAGSPFVERNITKSKNIFVRLWPQSGIIKRDKQRGNTFSHLVFMGRKENLHPALKSSKWKKFVDENNLKWSIKDDAESWKNYRNVDATISIRDFSGNPYHWKPATKLYNSWIAGVIPICGAESAYSYESNSDEDCLITHSYEQLCTTVIKLKNCEDFRIKCFNASRMRSHDITVERVTNEWVELIGGTLTNEYERWCALGKTKRLIFVMRRLFGYTIKKGLSKWT